MFEIFPLRLRHGHPLINDLDRAALPPGFRGLPLLEQEKCMGRCAGCVDACPTGALGIKPLRVDLGKCIFCGECERICTEKAVRFSSFHRLGTDRKERLLFGAGQSGEEYCNTAFASEKGKWKMFGRSLKLRQVSAGGCNGCELELSACNNVNFDAGRFGIEFTASPRHADGIVITGPITAHMAAALRDSWLGISSPKIIVAVGACSISGGLFAKSDRLERSFLNECPPDLFIPGCPPHPLTVIQALRDLLGKKAG